MAVGVTFAAARALKKSMVDLRLAVKDIPALLVKEPKFKAFSGTTKTPSKEECLVQKKKKMYRQSQKLHVQDIFTFLFKDVKSLKEEKVKNPFFFDAFFLSLDLIARLILISTSNFTKSKV